MRNHAHELGVSIVLGALAPIATADFSGFGDFSQFKVNQQDSAAAPPLFPDTGTIQLTSGSAQSRSVFNKMLQDIIHFTASFQYQVLNPISTSMGACLIFQNDPSGYDAVSFDYYTGFGYGFAGITKSVGTTLQMNGNNTSNTGLYMNGNNGGGAFNVSPLDFRSGHVFGISVIYDGALMHETIHDMVTDLSYSRIYALDITSVVGGSVAYVGIGAATGNGSQADQYISNFQFAVPAPGALALLSFAAIGRVRRRT